MKKKIQKKPKQHNQQPAHYAGARSKNETYKDGTIINAI